MKIVLYQPQQSDKARDGQSMPDLVPQEMIAIAPLPMRDGHECVLIDGSLYDREEAHARVLAACEDAAIFATTGILGFMVSDAYTVAEKVRARHPGAFRVAGGWFASCLPHLYLKDGVFDAVVLGQGELTFHELVQAVEARSSLDDVRGLALWRDGDLHETERRPVVGFDQLPDPAWELVDITPYKELALRPGAGSYYLRMPGPPWIGRRAPYFGISYFSSFGCPEPCTFCCSPFVTARRWKAKPAEKILDDLEMLQDRWGKIDCVRFLDANFGVLERRTREFAEGLLARDLGIGWNAFIETYSVCNYDESTLDLAARSGYYVAEVGAETGDEALMKRIGKPIRGDMNFEAAARLHDRGIRASVTYIIGFPHETEESMLATLDQARRIQLRCPESSTHVLPFRPIPGTKSYEEALELGFVPPDDIHVWGRVGQYHMHQTWNVIPRRIQRLRELHSYYTSLYKGVLRDRTGLFERMAAWRLRKDNYSLPLDAQLFSFLDRMGRRLRGRLTHREDLVDQALG